MTLIYIYLYYNKNVYLDTHYNLYLSFCIIFLYLSAEFFLGFFTSDLEVIKIAKIQLLYCPWGYGFLGLAAICNGSFDAFGKPMPAMTISIARTLIVYVPMAYWFASLMGIRGVFVAHITKQHK